MAPALRSPALRSEMASGWDGPGFCKVDVGERHRDEGAVNVEGNELEVKDPGNRREGRRRRGSQERAEVGQEVAWSWPGDLL